MAEPLKSILSTIDFSYNKLLPDETKIRWLPILRCGNAEYQMGILEDGDWAVEVSDGLYRLNEPRRYIFVMALLEKPINTIHKHLTEFFDSRAVKINLYEFFPFESIVRAGFEQGSEYWAELAFNWYQELPEENKYTLMDFVINIVDAKWASQKLRQKAKKEVRRIEQK